MAKFWKMISRSHPSYRLEIQLAAVGKSQNVVPYYPNCTISTYRTTRSTTNCLLGFCLSNFIPVRSYAVVLWLLRDNIETAYNRPRLLSSRPVLTHNSVVSQHTNFTYTMASLPQPLNNTSNCYLVPYLHGAESFLTADSCATGHENPRLLLNPKDP